MQQLNPTTAVTVSGSGITTRYVNKYVVHEFTQAASFVVSKIITASLIIVGGGGGGSSSGRPGNGGDVRNFKGQTLNTGTYNVTIGAGGGPNSSGGNTSLSGPGTSLTSNGGQVNTTMTSLFTFRFVNLRAAILYCTNNPPPPGQLAGPGEACNTWADCDGELDCRGGTCIRPYSD
jgi:hypothetical protein